MRANENFSLFLILEFVEANGTTSNVPESVDVVNAYDCDLNLFDLFPRETSLMLHQQPSINFINSHRLIDRLKIKSVPQITRQPIHVRLFNTRVWNSLSHFAVVLTQETLLSKRLKTYYSFQCCCLLDL